MNLSCHCGAVEIQIPDAPESITSCNCSICDRYGALWGYFKPDDVVISCEKSTLERYAWGDQNINFCHCKKCGCVTHYESSEKVDTPITALNFRMAQSSDIKSIKLKRFDGADTWKFLE